MPSLEWMLLYVALGGFVGFMAGLLGVGGGFLTLAYLGYKNVDVKKAIGTSAAIGFPIAIAGTLGYLVSGWTETMGDPNTLGFIYVPAFLAIALSSSIAAPLGARCSHTLPAATLKKIFATVSLTLSITMLFSIAEF